MWVAPVKLNPGNQTVLVYRFINGYKEMLLPDILRYTRAMDPVRNPYAPGAGRPPAALAGRGPAFTVPGMAEFIARQSEE